VELCYKQGQRLWSLNPVWNHSNCMSKDFESFVVQGICVILSCKQWKLCFLNVPNCLLTKSIKNGQNASSTWMLKAFPCFGRWQIMRSFLEREDKKTSTKKVFGRSDCSLEQGWVFYLLVPGHLPWNLLQEIIADIVGFILRVWTTWSWFFCNWLYFAQRFLF